LTPKAEAAKVQTPATKRFYKDLNAGNNWQWFESYLTYGNSILPEAMLSDGKVNHGKNIRC